MRRKSLVAVLMLLLVAAATSRAENLEKALNRDFKGRVLVLRHPIKAAVQDYDSSGNFKGSAPTGDWTLYGRVQTQRIKVRQDKLEFKGKRLHYRVDDGKRRLVSFADERELDLQVALAKPVNSVEEATAVLGKVFAMTDEDVVKSAPEWWQHYLAIDLKLIPDDNPVEGNRLRPLSHDKDDKVVTGPDGERIYAVKNGVVAPKVLYQREPEFSEEARKARYQGTVGLTMVVDRFGKVREVQLVRPSGMGLDERAANGVKNWRFQPATRNGEPVAVKVYVEVGFHFYGRF